MTSKTLISVNFRRFLAFVLLVTILTLSAPTQQASAQTTGDKTPARYGNRSEQVIAAPQSSLDNVKVWTDEEMRNAIPATYENMSKGQPETEQPSTNGPQIKVDGSLPEDYKQPKSDVPLIGGLLDYASGIIEPAWYTTFPYRAIGKVFFTRGDNNYTCSASVAGNNALWTAGHCVYNPDSNVWHSNWVFVPGFNTGSNPRPYGTWNARGKWALSGWINHGWWSYDIGMVTVWPDSNGKKISQRTGNLGYAANYSHYQLLTGIGYPGQSPFDGTKQAWCQDNTNNSWGRVKMDCNQTPGSSGGPWLMSFNQNSYNGNYVNGIFSTWEGAGENEMHSPYFGNGAIDIYNTTINE